MLKPERLSITAINAIGVRAAAHNSSPPTQCESKTTLKGKMNTNLSEKSSTSELLERLEKEVPEISSHAKIIGSWVWLEFNIAPETHVRQKLRNLGFHWNEKRRLWQNPCGPPTEPHQNSKLLSVNDAVATEPLKPSKEYKVVSLREVRIPESMELCDTPDKAAQYWKLTIGTNPYFNPECECFVVLMLNTRRRVKGHQLISIGTLDTILVHPREVFRGAIIAAAAAVVIMHNHPSGEPQPSEADIKVTRDLIRAGQLLKLEVLDHVIMGNPKHCSLRELGYFF
jgi:DNA repair protein RadC